MPNYEPTRTLAQLRNRQNLGNGKLQLPEKEKIAREKMTIIGGRPVIIPARTPNAAPHRAENIKLALAFVAIYIIWGPTYLAISSAASPEPTYCSAQCREP